MEEIKLGEVHRNALADILVKNLCDGKKYEHHIGAIRNLVDEDEAAISISIALQKAGVVDVRFAGHIAKALVNGKEVHIVQYKKEISKGEKL